VTDEYKECAECAAKPGSPTLCAACLHNRTTIDRLKAATGLRRLLWLRHGCKFAALYGDDGEMQCAECGVDFKRMTAEQIDAVFRRGQPVFALNPHNWLHKTCHPEGHCDGKHDPTWRCHYCGDEGTAAELESRACSHEYPPCSYCGQTPTCAQDCGGVAQALAGYDDTK
jgi:hypothetical protein